MRNYKNLSFFRLRVQFSTENGFILAEGISGGIEDARSTKIGALDIFDVTNRKSCYNGGRKINITSVWDLDKESVTPRLQVYDGKGRYLHEMTEELLSQPSVRKEDVEDRHIDFLSPSQTEDKIEKIYFETIGREKRRNRNTIKLLLKRSDGVESDKKIVFQYIPCNGNCDYCHRDVDGNGEREFKRANFGQSLSL